MKPNNDIEVVRCCDCKKCMTIANEGDREPLLLCEHWKGYPRVEPTDFCSCGERSTNAQKTVY